MSDEHDFRIRPGRIRSSSSQRARPFIAQALAATQRAGGNVSRSGKITRGNRSYFGRGKRASVQANRWLTSRSRNAVIKTRVVRHNARSAPLATHLAYLRREGVTRDGEKAQLFGPEVGEVDPKDFAERCEDDRHHFRFIVSPEDAVEMTELKSFTRDLMRQAEKDLGTQLDWVGVDHWNTEHPHIHVIARGRADDGEDLVIARDYIKDGMRARAQDLITQELGLRTDRDIRKTLERQIDAEHWTDLDRQLSKDAEWSGAIDLAPPRGGRLVDRGLDDELKGTAYAVIDGVDGRTHHIRLPHIDAAGDSVPGSIVELRKFEDSRGRSRTALAVRSDLLIESQVTANGATWLDREAISREATPLGATGFGRDVSEALDKRVDRLIEDGLAKRQGQRVIFNRSLIETLRKRELATVGEKLAAETGLPHKPSEAGEYVAGTYQRRLSLASGRFAMIGDGLGFQLVPWTPSIEKHLGQHVSGVARSTGGVDWDFGRKRGIGM